MKDKPYSKETKDLGTPDGFINVYWDQCKKYTTYEAAYEATELLHIKYFGYRRYKGYESFRVVKNRRIKKNK